MEAFQGLLVRLPDLAPQLCLHGPYFQARARSG